MSRTFGILASLLLSVSAWAASSPCIHDIDRFEEQILLDNGAIYGTRRVPRDWVPGQTVVIRGNQGAHAVELINQQTGGHIEGDFIGWNSELKRDAFSLLEKSLSYVTLSDGARYYVPFDSLWQWEEGDLVQVRRGHDRFEIWNMRLTNLACHETVRAERRG